MWVAECSAAGDIPLWAAGVQGDENWVPHPSSSACSTPSTSTEPGKKIVELSSKCSVQSWPTQGTVLDSKLLVTLMGFLQK